ncbi:thioredoxin family protein [Pontibacter sp. MBLB2868]|uniref:thioredoxin family protein n=1 Tax=Pontibacter sp. MBLB2868 TaxID=3451555 RepID=UPI003F74DAB6
MAQETAQVVLGSKAQNFALLDTLSDRLVTLNDVASPKATVIMFICNHCPYVKHMLEGLINVANQYIPKGVSFVAISANDAKAYPQDGPLEMKALAQQHKFPFPYLYDQTQQVARTYHAVCTPEFYVYDGSMRLAYHGQFDDSRPNNNLPVTGKDLALALDLVLANKPAQEQQKQSIGCSIKWRPQQE